MIATRILRPVTRPRAVRFLAGIFTSTFLFIERRRHVGDPLDDGDRREGRDDRDGRREELRLAAGGPCRDAHEVRRDKEEEATPEQSDRCCATGEDRARLRRGGTKPYRGDRESRVGEAVKR